MPDSGLGFQLKVLLSLNCFKVFLLRSEAIFRDHQDLFDWLRGVERRRCLPAVMASSWYRVELVSTIIRNIQRPV